VTTTGVEAAQHSRVVVNRSFIENATSAGVKSDDSVTNDAQLTIDHSDVSYNGVGVQAGAGATTNFVADCKIAFNGAAFGSSGGTNLSYGTNRIHSNGSDGPFSAASPGQR
jgi:hypothetical protein